MGCSVQTQDVPQAGTSRYRFRVEIGIGCVHVRKGAMLPRSQQLLCLQRKASQPSASGWTVSVVRGLRTRRCVPDSYVAVAVLPDDCLSVSSWVSDSLTILGESGTCIAE